MTSKEYLVEKLRSGSENWNQWRAENPNQARLNLNQVNLSGANLSGADLSGVDLTEANLSGANLRQAKLYASLLSGANLRSAELGGAVLNGAVLTRADLSSTDLSSTDLRSHTFLANQRLYDFFRSQYEPIVEAMNQHRQFRTNLMFANLQKANLCSAQLQDVIFHKANLSEALLQQSNLCSADLEEADLSGADLRGAFLNYIRLRNTIIPRTTKINERWRRLSLLLSDRVKKPYHWRGAELQGANLEGADLSEVVMHYADLRGANLRGANLIGADFSNTCRVGGAIWQGAKYSRDTILPYLGGIQNLILVDPPVEPDEEEVLIDLESLQLDGKPNLILVDPPVEPDEAEVLIDLESLQDERTRTNVIRVRREDQQKFRDMLKEAFQGKCAITCCDIEQALDAAHIFPYRGPQTDCLWNGILLRLDLHRLFDSYLLTIDSVSCQVCLSPSLMNSCYREYADVKVCFPEQPVSRNRKLALQNHNAQCSWLKRS